MAEPLKIEPGKITVPLPQAGGPPSGETQYDVIAGLVLTSINVGAVNSCMAQAGLPLVQSQDDILAILGAPPAGGGTDAPTNTVLPTITGTPQVGGTLTCNPGTWTGSPGLTYQWRANGTNIASNATSSTYVPIAAQVGKTLDCVVTGTNAQGSITAIAAAVGPVT